MKRLLVALCALPLLWLNSTGCSDSEEDGSGGGDSGARAAAILELTGDATAGQTSFESSCGLGAPSCHNSDGTAGSGNARDLTTDAPDMTDEFIINTVLNGQGSMPAQDTLDDQTIANIVAYIRSEWGG